MQYTSSILALAGTASMAYAQQSPAPAQSLFLGPIAQVPGFAQLASQVLEVSVVTSNPTATVYGFPCPSAIANLGAPQNEVCGLLSAITVTAVPTGIQAAASMSQAFANIQFAADCNTQNAAQVVCNVVPSSGAQVVATTYTGDDARQIPITVVNAQATGAGNATTPGATPAPTTGAAGGPSTPGATPASQTGAAGSVGQNVAMAGAAGAFALAFAL